MEPTPPRRSARPFIVLGVILGLIALAATGYWWLNKGYATTDDAQIDGDVYTISAQISGRVTKVLVADNQHVTAGQVLVVLDNRDEQVAQARAQAQAAQAQAALAQARAQADESQATLTQAQADFTRFTSVNPRATTQQQVDAATAVLNSDRAKAAAADAAVQAAGADLAAADAALLNTQLQLSYTTITAPAAGHVAMKTVEPGNVVAAGSAMMALVGDDVWVIANYKETQLPGIRLGADATVQVDAVPDITFTAKVDSIQYGTGAVFSLLPAQNATGNYVKIIQRVPVKLVFTDPRVSQYLLAPGMSVEPSVTISP